MHTDLNHNKKQMFIEMIVLKLVFFMTQSLSTLYYSHKRLIIIYIIAFVAQVLTAAMMRYCI